MCSVVVVVVLVVILYFLVVAVVVVLLSRWEGKRADFFFDSLRNMGGGAKSSHFFEYPHHPILGICCLDQVKLFHPDCHVS
jgi:hypothetical protein